MDLHTHTDRIEVQNEHWGVQIEQLVSVYLNYRTQDGGDGMPSFPPSDEPILDGDCVSLKNIELVDIFSKVQGTSTGFIVNVIQVRSMCCCSLVHLTGI